MPSQVRPVQYRVTSTSRVQEVIADHGYGDGAACGCNHGGPTSGRGPLGLHCRPALLPCVFDNIPDLFICLLPTRAHCCPYPKTCREPSCWNQPVGCCNRQPLLNGLFARHSRCGVGGCNSCASRGTPDCGCEAMHQEAPSVEMLPPQPEPAMDEAFFKQEAAALHRQRGVIGSGVKTVTTEVDASPGLNRPMTTRSVMTPKSPRKSPAVIKVGNAMPLRGAE
jgi:hypothetical protein